MSDASPLESIFFAALEKQPGADRCAYLDDACAVDDGLRRRVEGMLAAEGEAGNFLQCPPPGATSEWPLTEHPGSQIGAYKLLLQRHRASFPRGEQCGGGCIQRRTGSEARRLLQDRRAELRRHRSSFGDSIPSLELIA